MLARYSVHAEKKEALAIDNFKKYGLMKKN